MKEPDTTSNLFLMKEALDRDMGPILNSLLDVGVGISTRVMKYFRHVDDYFNTAYAVTYICHLMKSISTYNCREYTDGRHVYMTSFPVIRAELSTSLEIDLISKYIADTLMDSNLMENANKLLDQYEIMITYQGVTYELDETKFYINIEFSFKPGSIMSDLLKGWYNRVCDMHNNTNEESDEINKGD